MYVLIIDDTLNRGYPVLTVDPDDIYTSFGERGKN